jgi:cation/acetate symporter
MDVKTWTFLIIVVTFAMYIAVAIWSRARSTRDFYVASKGVHPVANGMATAADWMSAASFISMAGIIAFMGADGAIYLMGWTGGYVLLALLLAPYLRKFGKFTVPDFVGDRYGSQVARIVAVLCAIFISFTYVAGQMRGVGIVFSRFLEISVDSGIYIGMGIVFFYAVLGGMKGITYTQVVQYCVLIFAFMVPAIYISLMMAGHPIPQIGLGMADPDSGVFLLEKLDGLQEALGFTAYTDGSISTLNMVLITAALMVGTAGLPHVIIRFYTVPRVRDARISAGWALLFIAILYTTAPAVAVFAKTNLLETIPGTRYVDTPQWFRSWEDTELLAWGDRNGDGVIDYAPGKVFEGKITMPTDETTGEPLRGAHGQRIVSNEMVDGVNELHIDRDIMVLANPEIAGLPAWVIGLVAAGGLAAALSTAAGLLLVVSTAVSHDLLKRVVMPRISERGELWAARSAAAAAVVVAGYLGLHPPGFVAEVVAFAFGLAASSFFPVILLGIFWKRTNQYGAIAGMICGITFTASYIVWFRFMHPELDLPEHWLLGISPKGIGTLGMAINFVITVSVSLLTPPPCQEIQELVESIRTPGDTGRTANSPRG